MINETKEATPAEAATVLRKLASALESGQLKVVVVLFNGHRLDVTAGEEGEEEILEKPRPRLVLVQS